MEPTVLVKECRELETGFGMRWMSLEWRCRYPMKELYWTEMNLERCADRAPLIAEVACGGEITGRCSGLAQQVYKHCPG